MQILSLSFGRTPDTPPVHRGIAIALGPSTANSASRLVLGACRQPVELVGEDRVDIARAIFLTASGETGPRAGTVNLVGERLVFEHDVQRLDDDWICAFRCELDVSSLFSCPYMLHASLYGAISNTLWVA